MTNPADQIESRLELMFRVPMSADVASRIESRLAPAISQRAERKVGRPIRRSLPFALASVLLITAGAAVAGTLFSRIADSGPSDYRLAWEQGSDVGVSIETPQGPVTVVRGYADRLRVVLAVQITTVEQVAGLRLTDETGRHFMPNGGPGFVSDAEGTGFLLAFVPDEPLVPGVHTFSLTSDAYPERTPITFELVVQGGEPIRNGTPAPHP